MRDRPKPGRPVHRRSVVIAQVTVGSPRVQGRPDADGSRCQPIDGRQAGLDLCGGDDRIPRAPEHEEPAVALATGLHREAIVGADRLVDDLVVLLERPHHEVRRLLPQPGAALDVGEEERDDL